MSQPPRLFATNCDFPKEFVTPQSGTGLTSRSFHRAVVAVTSVRLYFTNAAMTSTAADLANANAISVKASAEVGGTLYPVCFAGVRTKTLAPGEGVWSDALTLTIPAETTFYVRTFASVASAALTLPWTSIQSIGTLGSDATDAIGTVGSSAAYAYYPAALTGIPAARHVTVGMTGDSILAGNGDSTQSLGWENIGFGARALAGVPAVRVAVTSDRFSTWVAAGNHDYRLKPITDTLAGCTHVLCAYGTNDITGGDALATVQASAVAAWRLFAAAHLPVWQTTITPTTTSSDSWATVGNQTLHATNAVRTGFNDWLRDGAPMTGSFVAAATGTAAAGTIRAGSSTHPLTGFFDTADTVESARNSGRWAAGKTSDGVHPNAAGHLLMAAAVLPARFVLPNAVHSVPLPRTIRR